MQIVTSVSVVVCSMVLATGAASAQDARDGRTGSSPPQRGYVSALAGATFATDTSPIFAVEYGDNVGRHAQGYVTFTYFNDLITDSTRNEMRTLGTVLSRETGSPWEFDARDRGVAFVAGGKFLVPTGTGVRPYFGGGAGAINVTRTITERRRGDLTSAIVGEGLTDPTFSAADFSATKPMVEGIVGVGIVAGHTYVDLGYRYRKAFHFATPLDFGQFSVGIGYRF